MSLKRLLASSLLSVAVLFSMALAASAATLNVVGGQLLGASGVDVGGTLYDVEFLDGACTDLYTGCNDAADFTFKTNAQATLAAQALLDQVFLDGVSGMFDSSPELTSGCSATFRCIAWTPYTPPVVVNVAVVGALNNDDNGAPDVPTNSSFVPTDDFTAEAVFTYAVWSPVPEPVPALAPLGITTLLSLLGLVGWRRLRA